MDDTISIGRIRTELGEIFFLPYDDRYVIFGLEEAEDPDYKEVSLALRQITGSAEAFFADPLPVRMGMYRERFVQACNRFDDLNRRYGHGDHSTTEMEKRDASVVDELASLCREIVESSGYHFADA